MSDTKVTSESTSGPFETYRTSLREMKEEAAQARKTADALDAEVRKSANALDVLEEAIPQWWQMFELTNREVPYQPFQMWQEQAREVLESAQSDFLSGNTSRIRSGGNKTLKVKSELKDKKNKIEEEYKTKKKKIENKNEKINQKEDKISKKEETVGSKNKGLIYSAVGSLLFGAFAAFIYWLVVGILINILGLIFDFSFSAVTILFMVTVLAVWSLVSFRYYSDAKEKSGVDNISNEIKQKKKKVEKIRLKKNEIENELDIIKDTRKNIDYDVNESIKT